MVSAAQASRCFSCIGRCRHQHARSGSFCAAGKVDNRIVLDINDEEDKEGQADMPVAYMPRLEQVTLRS